VQESQSSPSNAPKLFQAIEGAFGMDVDYTVLLILYGNDSHDTRYNSGGCIGTQTAVLAGSNAFGKKIEDHQASVAMYFMYYKFCRVHQTLRVTPAMEAGLTDHVLVESGDDWAASFKLTHYPSISLLAFPEDQDVDCGIR
jgi:hypothetical protein